jgi:phthiocerol/phenolphthiocerol synthesis type-I polyketide synthase C
MNSVHYLRDKIAVVGWACRLPGASSVEQLWSLLLEGRCAISSVPPDRFSLSRFGHPRRQERGKSYTWAAGILDDLWSFDPSVFGISPREAVQMDPQQRLLLQMTWEALENAGITPSSIAGTEVGVYVGGSQSDYGQSFFADYAIADSQFATGTALAILSNRISYAFDLRGPSFTVDTACSSSLVALHQAAEALRTGRVDTAIVAGINVIASPAAFIAFSQASMLSPTGLCHAFSDDADGFVRAEGGVVMVLRRAAQAKACQNPVHGLILASDVNSDGRTNGISLPSLEAQEALLSRVYSRSGISPDRLAFVEAHGTGTPAGDPIEATALGRALGPQRSTPLPIGSIKTNIGHLEPASGIAGLMKAMLALNHGILPKSLHFTAPNRHIDFGDLNLAVCKDSLLLPASGQRCAGVNSFGFGGTNAHVIVEAGQKSSAPAASEHDREQRYFFLSAETKPALTELAQQFAARVPQLSERDTSTLASAIAHRRERMSERLVVASMDGNVVGEALKAFAAGEENDHLTSGTAVAEDVPVAFVYSGNGSQWVGMGCAAYRNNAAFRDRFDEVSRLFEKLAGWSLRDAIFAEDLEERLPQSSVAQPLIFAIQSAATAALRARGLHAAAVLGHSVGEVAAAEAAEILDLPTAVKVIYYRSQHQELTRLGGRMAAVLSPPDSVAPIVAAIPGLEIAAVNSPRAVTIAGTAAAIAEFKRVAGEQRIAVLELELDYPFHTALMEPVRKPLLDDLKSIAPQDAKIPFVSTVTGAVMPGARLDSTYWWRNVREPVRFSDSVRNAAKLGVRYFVEIGPRGMLLKHISDSLEGESTAIAKLSILERKDDDVDPFDRAISKVLVDGGQVDIPAIFGGDPGPSISLPTYPWQQTHFRFAQSTEAVGTEAEHHPFLGARLTSDMLEWHSHIDINLFPDLADHRVGEQIIFPGTGFLEIGLAAAQKWLKTEQVMIADCEIMRPLDLTGGETRELMTRISAGSGTVEVFSRPRLSQAAWLLHTRAKILHANPGDAARAPAFPRDGQILEGEDLYRIAIATGLNYGPAFRLVERAAIYDERMVSVDLAPRETNPAFLLNPVRLDACVHSMITQFPELRAEERGVTFIPVRVDESVLFRPHAVPARALMEIVSKSERSVLANFFIYDADGEVIAIQRGARCQALPIKRTRSIDNTAFIERSIAVDGSVLGESGVAATPDAILANARKLGFEANGSMPADSAMLLLEGWATSVAFEFAQALADRGRIDLARLIETGRLPEPLGKWFANLMTALEGAELVIEGGPGIWRVTKGVSLPKPASIVEALHIEHPAHAPELLIAGALTGIATEATTMRSIPAAAMLSSAVLDFHDLVGTAVREGSEVLWRILNSTEAFWPEARALRVLSIGYSPLVEKLAFHESAAIEITVLETGRRSHDRATNRLASAANVRLLEAENADKLDRYDVILSVSGLHRLPAEIGFERLRAALLPGGLMTAVEPAPSLFKDLVSGLEATWFAEGATEFPLGSLRSSEQWESELRRADFKALQCLPVRYGAEEATLLSASVPIPEAVAAAQPEAAPAAPKRALIVGPANFAAGLGDGIEIVPGAADLSDFAAIGPDLVMIDAPLTQAPDPAAALAERCLQIKACAERMAESPVPLWLIFAGARAGAAAPNPVETGAWAFSRTLANEFPKIDVRRIDVSLLVSREKALAQIRALLLSDTNETELHIESDAVRAVRVQELARAPVERRTRPEALSLVRQLRSNTRLAWRPTARREIGPDEIEIAVEATGLNFRDLMWTLGLLPDDMLENGYTGPALGLECAGLVSRAGKAVKKLRVGDRVLAMAPSAFSTHAVVTASRAGKIPDNMSFTSATTIPVGFLTAYYSLVTLARVQRGEWILIHGAAGGVGMAALQIARARRAKIIATAGSPAKRALLRALGVRHVLDSRAPNIVDQVRAIAGNGVDVVLNSLAGEAMERAIACLAPFGRFVELGKRDYVSNTHIGLRPFRRNLSYFGVDVDQLVGKQKALGERAFADVMRQFAKGTYSPLPHSVFPAADVADAFDLMQRSNHVGKIVVRAPDLAAVSVPAANFSVSKTGTHVITGAFGGFGLETAKWLVDRGARHLVLTGRRGPATAEAHALLARLRDQGVEIMAEACDVSDREALDALFLKIGQSMPAICGIMHAAMVLDDAVIPNLDLERFLRVFEPKVLGAENLDAATRAMNLDYFVLYSSVTTIMGNPGQGNYVAANAYMEGLARRRRKAGLPALAIGWGPITDVGVLANNEQLQANLKKLTGVSGMRAREALELMEQALARGGDRADTAVITISPNDTVFSAERLAVLRSPTYAAMTKRGQQAEGESAQIDLRALIDAEGIDAARRKASDVIVVQLARVLHAQESEISRTRPLADIGLDSLMALELVGNLETAFGISIPLSTSAGTLTVTGVADAILANFDAEGAEKPSAVTALAEQHLETVPAEDIKGVAAMIEGESRKISRVIS